MNKSADLILTNANIITMDPENPEAKNVLIKNGRIVYVGNMDSCNHLIGNSTEVIDLKGKTLMPGFIESHMHPLLLGTSLLEVDCRVNSIDKMLEKISVVIKNTPKGQWIRGWGWDDSKFKERRNPTRWDLDKIAPDHPVYLKRTCAHVAVVNSKALELSGITKDTNDPVGGHFVKDVDSGMPNGVLQETAMEYVPLPSYTIEQFVKGMDLAQKQLGKRGITTVHDMATEAEGFRVYQKLLNEDKFSVRMRVWFSALKQIGFNGVFDEVIGSGLQSGFGNDILKIQGMKFILDGSIGGKTAAVADSYVNDPENYGIIYTSEADLNPKVFKSLQAGLRVAIHAIGETSIELAIRAIENAGREIDVTSMRNRIEHCGLPTKNQIERIIKHKIIPGSSIGFIYSLGDSYYKNLGPERMKRVYPHRTYLEQGIIAPGNSDCPVTEANPFWGIYGAVTRKTMGGQIVDNEQSISVKDALELFTIHAAYSSFEENVIGSIKENKFADMIVLSDNPLEVPADSLKDIGVELTIMNGKITHKE